MFCCFPDGPVSLAIEPKKDSYSVGESINITVDCKPSPDHFKWTNNVTGVELGSQQSLKLTKAMVGKQSFLVSVCNTVPNSRANTSDSICKEQLFDITVTLTGKSTIESLYRLSSAS